MTPYNRSDVKAARHFANWVLFGIWFVLWLTSFLVMRALFNSVLPQSSNTITAFFLAIVPSTFIMGIVLPIFLLTWHPKVRTQYSIPIVPPKVPQWLLDRPKPKVIPGTIVEVYNYPLKPFLATGWQQRYFYIEDSEMEAKVAQMCSEVLTQWRVTFPNKGKPPWFADLADQARDLLTRMQTSDVILECAVTNESGTDIYFAENGRWPDEWYTLRNLPIPPPGPDPDWYMPNPLTPVVNAAMVAGVTYFSTIRPIMQHHKHHKH